MARQITQHYDHFETTCYYCDAVLTFPLVDKYRDELVHRRSTINSADLDTYRKEVYCSECGGFQSFSIKLQE